MLSSQPTRVRSSKQVILPIYANCIVFTYNMPINIDSVANSNYSPFILQVLTFLCKSNLPNLYYSQPQIFCVSISQLKYLKSLSTILLMARQCEEDGFHLHRLVLPFVHQFNFRIEVLVYSSFGNDQLRKISTTFQHHFKIWLLWFLHKKEQFKM